MAKVGVYRSTQAPSSKIPNSDGKKSNFDTQRANIIAKRVVRSMLTSRWWPWFLQVNVTYGQITHFLRKENKSINEYNDNFDRYKKKEKQER